MKLLSIKLSSLLFCLLVVCSSILYTSCGPDDKCRQDIACKNGGTCQNNGCLCPTGFDGNDCSHDQRSRFAGNWTQNENSTSGGKFPISILIGQNAAQVIVKNFDNTAGDPVTGFITDKNTVSFNTETIKGSFVFVSETMMNAQYSIKDAAGNTRNVNTTIGQ